MARFVFFAGVVLAVSTADAHAVAFDFVDPSGASNRTDGGLFTLTWFDGPDPLGTTLVRLFASRPSVAPWGTVDGGVTLDITPGAVAIADPANAYTWDAGGAAPGCYQAWARLNDPLEGASTIVARGLVTVSNGGKAPPAVWVTNPSTARPNDAGIFSLTFAVDAPDDATQVTLDAQQATGAPVRLASDLPFTSGGGNGSFPVDARALGSGIWFLHAMVSDSDGGTCDAWWDGALYLSGGADAGSDGGVDDGGSGSGGGDGGAGGGGGGGGGTSTPCGCAASTGLTAFAALLLAGVSRRRPAR